MQKMNIKSLIIQEKTRLGSAAKVAVKCGVSEATISQVINQKWDQITDKMWRKIAERIGYKDNGWQMVETYNVKLLRQVFSDAKNNHLWLMVSHKAGSGKTAASKAYATENGTSGVYLIQCREWNRSQFLRHLCEALGVSSPKGMPTAEEMLTLVCNYFHQQAEKKPILIIDEADKLNPDGLRVMIPLFNSLEDRMGCVIMGTDNLERDVLNGLHYNKKGYDEIHSRFGRSFIHLYGSTRADVRKICEVNGVADPDKIEAIWYECNPIQVQINETFVKMVTDMRKLKRAVQREILKSKS